MSNELHAFDRHKRELCARYPGQFALLVGDEVLGVEPSLEAALATAAEQLEGGRVARGVPVLITEIAEFPRVRLSTELAAA